MPYTLSSRFVCRTRQEGSYQQRTDLQLLYDKQETKPESNWSDFTIMDALLNLYKGIRAVELET